MFGLLPIRTVVRAYKIANNDGGVKVKCGDCKHSVMSKSKVNSFYCRKHKVHCLDSLCGCRDGETKVLSPVVTGNLSQVVAEGGASLKRLVDEYKTKRILASAVRLASFRSLGANEDVINSEVKILSKRVKALKENVSYSNIKLQEGINYADHTLLKSIIELYGKETVLEKIKEIDQEDAYFFEELSPQN